MTLRSVRPEEVAPGVFFLRGATRYFEEGSKTGACGRDPKPDVQ